MRVHPAGGGAAALRAVRLSAGRTPDPPPPTHPRLGGVPTGGADGNYKRQKIKCFFMIFPLTAGGGASHAGAAVPGRGGAEGRVGGDPGRPVPGGPPPPGRDLVTNLRKV